MSDIAVIGAGQTVFGRKNPVAIRELCFDAYKEAMEGLDITKADIDASITCSAPEYDKQRTPSGLISEYLELTPKPAFYIETVCSSSTTGLRVAWALIKSGLHNVVAVIGFEKMMELSSKDSMERMGRGADIMWESPFGLSMPAGEAMFTRARMQKYGMTEEQMAKVKVKSSKYSALNPKAIFQREVSLEECLTARAIAAPLKFYDCCSNADGASCIILANGDKAKKMTDTPVNIIGLGAASDRPSLGNNVSLTGLNCAVEAGKQAYKMAGVEPKSIDVAEVNECFTNAEIMAYENLGFCKPGEGGRLVEEAQTYIDGDMPVNIDGGLLGKGHPIGATGGSQVRTIVMELRGDAGKLQVKARKKVSSL